MFIETRHQYLTLRFMKKGAVLCTRAIAIFSRAACRKLYESGPTVQEGFVGGFVIACKPPFSSSSVRIFPVGRIHIFRIYKSLCWYGDAIRDITVARDVE